MQFCYHELAISHPHGSSKSEQVNYYVTNPPPEYSISLNNIGSFNATQGKIFTCLKPYQNGVLAPIGGVSEFSIAFSIISGAEGTMEWLNLEPSIPMETWVLTGKNYLAAVPTKQLLGFTKI